MPQCKLACFGAFQLLEKGEIRKFKLQMIATSLPAIYRIISLLVKHLLDIANLHECMQLFNKISLGTYTSKQITLHVYRLSQTNLKTVFNWLSYMCMSKPEVLFETSL